MSRSARALGWTALLLVLLGAAAPVAGQVGPPVDGQPSPEQAAAAAELLRSLVGVLVAAVGLISLLGTVLDRAGTGLGRRLGARSSRYSTDRRGFLVRVAGFGGLSVLGAAVAAGGEVMWAALALTGLVAVLVAGLWLRAR